MYLTTITKRRYNFGIKLKQRACLIINIIILKLIDLTIITKRRYNFGIELKLRAIVITNIFICLKSSLFRIDD